VKLVVYRDIESCRASQPVGAEPLHYLAPHRCAWMDSSPCGVNFDPRVSIEFLQAQARPRLHEQDDRLVPGPAPPGAPVRKPSTQARSAYHLG